MFDINNYINTSKIPQAVHDAGNFSFANKYGQGLVNFGFSSYTSIMGSWFWGLTLGLVLVALWSWKQNVYLAAGFGVAILVFGAIMLGSLYDFIGLIVGMLIAGILYNAFIRKDKDKRSRRETK